MNEAQSEIPKPAAGAQLTAGREQAGWSLVQAADRLHLDVAAVKALEAGQFDALGGAVYARGHLRRYAELLGLPVSEVEAAYAQANPPKHLPDPKRSVSLFGNASAGAGALGPWTVAVGAVVVVIVALVWWAMRMPHKARTAGVTGGVTAGANNSVQAVDAAAAPSSPQGSSPGLDSPAADAPGAVAPGAVGPGAAASTAGAAATELSTTAQSGPKVDLGLKFKQGSWAEIYDAAGTRLFSDFGSAGTERRLNGTAPLSILLGKPSAVSLELDGHPVALGASAAGNSALRFSLDGGGHLFDVQAQHPAPARAHGRP